MLAHHLLNHRPNCLVLQCGIRFELLDGTIGKVLQGRHFSHDMEFGMRLRRCYGLGRRLRTSMLRDGMPSLAASAVPSVVFPAPGAPPIKKTLVSMFPKMSFPLMIRWLTPCSAANLKRSVKFVRQQHLVMFAILNILYIITVISFVCAHKQIELYLREAFQKAGLP